MDLHEKSLRILELPAILDMLAAEAVSETAKQKAYALRPSGSIYHVKNQLAETTAAKKMMVLRSSPPFSGVKDIRATVQRAALSGTLNAKELLEVAGLLRASASAIAYSTRDRRANDSDESVIDHLFYELRANKALENKIFAAIVSEEEISDNASSELANIRRHMRISADKVRQALNKIITSPTFSKALQEPIITMRNDRYVVPVKVEHKSTIPGLVHDISSSGATQFVEPMAVVQINNELKELAAKEKAEIERILSELSANVAADGENILNDFEILVTLDFIFAKAKLSFKQEAISPIISDEERIYLRNAKHPLLPQKEAVPIDIWLGGEVDTLIITGPNTGGKTVSLKTLGLLCAMAQCGLHIPVSDGSVVPVFEKILADIGDEQSIEQSLSTFSSHMTNIAGILSDGGSRSLLLFDEIGAGTDPVEGAALAIAIIEYARSVGAAIAATTHYAELKTYAVTTPGVVNASCEFDIETLRPTFRLIIGIPGKSNAFAISRRLGLPEEIISDASKRVNTDNASFEDALANLETLRLVLENERYETSKLLREAREEYHQAELLRTKIEKEHATASVSAKGEAAKILNDARKMADSVMEELRELQRKAASEANWQTLNESKAGLYRRLNEAETKLLDNAIDEAQKVSTRDPMPGDRVQLRNLGTHADVISVSAEGILSLQAGILKITAHKDEVILVEEELHPEIIRQLRKTEVKLREVTAKPEIDLRGMTTQEAIPILDLFLDSAIMAKLVSVRIIHGKGTGAMRNAVHQYLRQNHTIKSYRLGVFGEGEDGVTLVEL